MKEIIKIVITLVSVYVVAGFILTAVYAWTSPIKYKAEQIEKENALKMLAPDAEKIVKKGDWVVHEKKNEYYEAMKGGNVIGYLATTAGKGYSSYIKTLVYVDKDIKVKAIGVLSHGETPGFVDDVLLPSFTNQFKEKKLDQIELVRTETKDKIQAVSGSTRSSTGVTEGVKEAVKMLNEKYGKKEG